MKKIILLTLTALLITSCLPQDTQIPQSPLLPFLERKSGMIAYIGADGNAYISDQAGGQLAQLTDDAQLSNTANSPIRFYQFPTWSKDGSQLAFVGLGVSDTNEADLLIHNLVDEATTTVYSSQSEIPFYLQWSPDNENIGFITNTFQQDNIILQSVPSAGGERKILDTGSPYYWSWSPDGSVMIVHTGSSQSSTPEHLSFLRMDAETTEDVLDLTPVSFQAPAWSPDGNLIALAVSSNGKNQVIVTDAAGENPKTIGTFTAKTALAWSFDSTRLAFLDAKQTFSDGTVGALHIYDMETGEVKVEDKNIIAFFWSPNGEKIAYFVLVAATNPASDGSTDSTNSTQQQYAVQLHVLDVTSGESKELFTYQPTDQFLNILPYFDQYHQSATIWSPDNNNLVISFISSDGSPGIAIVAASGNLQPRLLTNGYIAFWSWD